MPSDPVRTELAASVVRREQQLRRHLSRFVDPELPPGDLTLPQLRVLMLVRAAPGITGHDLAEQLGVSTPTVSGLVDRLVGKALVTRETDPVDRRRVRLSLSGQGEEVLDRLEAAGNRFLDALLVRLDPEDLRDLDRVLARLVVAAHEAYPPEPPPA